MVLQLSGQVSKLPLNGGSCSDGQRHTLKAIAKIKPQTRDLVSPSSVSLPSWGRDVVTSCHCLVARATGRKCAEIRWEGDKGGWDAAGGGGGMV